MLLADEASQKLRVDLKPVGECSPRNAPTMSQLRSILKAAGDEHTDKGKAKIQFHGKRTEFGLSQGKVAPLGSWNGRRRKTVEAWEEIDARPMPTPPTPPKKGFKAVVALLGGDSK